MIALPCLKTSTYMLGYSQGRSSSPTKLSSTWQIRSDSARVTRPTKAAKSLKAQDKQNDEAGLLPAVSSVSSMSASSTLDIHPEIRTGNDVVEFYAKYGQDSPIKFFYCNRYFDIVMSMHHRSLCPCTSLAVQAVLGTIPRIHVVRHGI